MGWKLLSRLDKVLRSKITQEWNIFCMADPKIFQLLPVTRDDPNQGRFGSDHGGPQHRESGALYSPGLMVFSRWLTDSICSTGDGIGWHHFCTTRPYAAMCLVQTSRSSSSFVANGQPTSNLPLSDYPLPLCRPTSAPLLAA